MNYKNLLFSMFFILSLGCVPSIPAMETKSREQQSSMLLFSACEKGNIGLIKYLIENGANVNTKDNEKKTLLHHASCYGHFELVKYLIEKGTNINAKDHEECVPLHFACQDGYLEVVKHLIEKGADINAEDNNKWTPLHHASYHGHFELVKYLIEKGTNINAKDHEEWAPLHFACQEGHLEVVKHLIEKGANINAKDHEEWAPLHFACQDGHLEVVKHLIEKGADINAEDNNKWTPLYLACQEGHLEVVKHLIEKGANINTKDHDEKCTILHVAAHNGQIKIVQYLLNLASELIEAQTIDGFTALDIAYEEKKEAVVKLFTQHGVRTTSEKQAEANMRAFFAELDKEASQAQSKSAQKKQKKLENQKRRALQNQNINTNVIKQNNSGVSQQVSKAIEMSPAVINPTINDSVNNDVKPIILADKQIEANASAITSSEPNSIIISEPAIIVSTANAIHNFLSKADTICSPGSCINNSSVSDNKVIITPKKQQNSIQKPNNKPVQPNQPRQINNGYQVGHDAKLKWPRSLAGAKYDLMRDHLRQLKHWPETTGLDIKQLKGQVGMFRLRVGGYRVLFMVNEVQRRIVIHEIGLRKKVYRGL